MNQSVQCEKNILPQITAGLFLWFCTCHVSAAVSATPPPSQLPEDEQFNSCFLSEDISSVPQRPSYPNKDLTVVKQAESLLVKVESMTVSEHLDGQNSWMVIAMLLN